MVAALLWAMYLALEPYVRKLWPDGLLGWSRLLGGHIRDPRVGGDLLIGLAAGVVVSLIEVGRVVIISWLGYRAPSPTYGRGVDALNGAGMLAATWMWAVMRALQGALIVVLLVVLVRLALRRPRLSTLATAVLLSLLAMPNAGTTDTSLVFAFVLATGVVLTWVLYRSGLLAFAVAWCVWNVLTTVPMMPTVSHWSAAAGNWTIALLAGLALVGLYAARAGQPPGSPVVPWR